MSNRERELHMFTLWSTVIAKNIRWYAWDSERCDDRAVKNLTGISQKPRFKTHHRHGEIPRTISCIKSTRSDRRNVTFTFIWSYHKFWTIHHISSDISFDQRTISFAHKKLQRQISSVTMAICAIRCESHWKHSEQQSSYSQCFDANWQKTNSEDNSPFYFVWMRRLFKHSKSSKQVRLKWL
jgi:hypothetical protein